MNSLQHTIRVLAGLLATGLICTPRAVADEAYAPAKEGYPRFSWATVPVYKMFGHDTRLLSDDEISIIAASSDFICIEKQHGRSLLGGAERGAAHEAARFKAANPGIKVLFYWNASVAYPFTTFTQEFAVPTGGFAGLAGDRSLSDARRAWLVNDPKTGHPATRDGQVYYFDVLNTGFRRWWSDTAGRMVRESACDGIFLDQLHSAGWLRPDRADAIRSSMKNLMAMTRQAMGKEALLLANNGARQFPDAADGFMFEHYNDSKTTREALLEDWALMKKIAEAGKFSVFRMKPDLKGTAFENATRLEQHDLKHPEIGALSKERIEYPLACFLIGAQPHAYFCYNWSWGLTTGPLLDYAEFKRPLGKPKGAYLRQPPDGWLFTREFEHASIWLDLEKKKGRITWHGNGEGSAGGRTATPAGTR